MKRNSVLAMLVFFVFISILGVVYYKNQTGKIAGTSTEQPVVQQVSGIILPHHNLAEELIFSSLEKIKTEPYEYIVIFGPNHFVPESPTFVSADQIEHYPLATNIIGKMRETFPDVEVSNSLVEKEHSIMLHLPSLQTYFPHAKIIPLVISPRYQRQDLREKINFLDATLPKNTLYIASVDFSHNMMLLEAMEKNEESIKVLQNFDYQTLLGFQDDHTDSPVSLALLLMAMEQKKATHWETWVSSHGALLTGDQTIQGTSYVIGVFR